MKKTIECSFAISEVVKNCNPEVIAAYPITPSTHVCEELARYYADGELREFIPVEAEMSAISALVGAAATGGRTFTTTSSQGLLLMHEVLFNASGMRLPIVMFVANRAVSAPLSIWTDHQDSISQRDAGWIQLYAKNSQEIIDSLVQAYKIAEKVKIPTMVCGDGFFLTHVVEEIDIPDVDLVKKYLPKLEMEYKLDPEKPITLGNYAVPADYQQFREDLCKDIGASVKVIEAADNEWKKLTGRGYGLFEAYKVEDAERVIVAMGSQANNGKVAVDKLREKGEKVGMLILRLFRPFPYQQLAKVLADKEVLVLDRSISPGADSPVYSEISNALYGKAKVYSAIGGLGGRDLTIDVYLKLFDQLKKGKIGKWVY